MSLNGGMALSLVMALSGVMAVSSVTAPLSARTPYEERMLKECRRNTPHLRDGDHRTGPWAGLRRTALSPVARDTAAALLTQSVFAHAQ